MWKEKKKAKIFIDILLENSLNADPASQLTVLAN